MRVFLIITVVFFGLLPNLAAAHTRSQSFSNWSVEGESLLFTFTVDARRVTQLAPLYDSDTDIQNLLGAHIKNTVSVVQNGQACKLGMLKSLGEGRSKRRVSGQFVCSAPVARNTTTITISAFFVVSPTHIHIARVENYNTASEFALREGREAFTLSQTKSGKKTQNTFLGFVSTGFFHVLSGLDHIVFLVALAFVATRRTLAVLCISGFTLGHTLTLALATLGLIDPETRLIEAMIGFTIAMMALEAGSLYGLNRRRVLTIFAIAAFMLFSVLVGGVMGFGIGALLALYSLGAARQSTAQMRRYLPVLTIAFGLIHGAGFAGGLEDANIVRGELLRPLLGFNIGVELAQLVILTLVYGAVYAINLRTVKLREYAPKAVSLAIFTMGSFWFVQRLLS